MNAAAVFDYQSKTRELFLSCNLCGRLCEIDWAKDRYGYPIGVSTCECGLVFINPRMTAEAYRQFYATGAYRRLVSEYHGRPINADTLPDEQRPYARWLRVVLEPYLGPLHVSLLDVGGSTGIVACVVGNSGDRVLSKTVLDPAVDELEVAQGVEVIPGTIEDFDPAGRTWDVVLLCQTIDHLLDPMEALRKIGKLLAPGGVFWVDALDYDRTRTLKIDHPYNLTEATMGAYLRETGFEVLHTVRRGDHVGFVCGR